MTGLLHDITLYGISERRATAPNDLPPTAIVNPPLAKSPARGHASICTSCCSTYWLNCLSLATGFSTEDASTTTTGAAQTRP
eukprot:scaffold105331_cov22-Prasinocladus_malaysianus.AAC.1